jgi:hypothetical protein
MSVPDQNVAHEQGGLATQAEPNYGFNMFGTPVQEQRLLHNSQHPMM